MNDLISRQTALRALEEINYALWEIDIPSPTVPEYIEHHEQVKKIMDLVDEWARKLMAMPNADQRVESVGMHWIPCAERLPDITEHNVSDPCIVYCSNGAYGFAELEENIFGQVGWNCERDDEYHEPLGEVVAWMPLSYPWKEEK